MARNDRTAAGPGHPPRDGRVRSGGDGATREPRVPTRDDLSTRSGIDEPWAARTTTCLGDTGPASATEGQSDTRERPTRVRGLLGADAPAAGPTAAVGADVSGTVEGVSRAATHTPDGPPVATPAVGHVPVSGPGSAPARSVLVAHPGRARVPRDPRPERRHRHIEHGGCPADRSSGRVGALRVPSRGSIALVHSGPRMAAARGSSRRDHGTAAG